MTETQIHSKFFGGNKPLWFASKMFFALTLFVLLGLSNSVWAYELDKKALEQEESSADAHFLYAANLGKAVQLQGLMAAALSLQTLKHHVNRVLELDEEHAPAHHILGRLYEELPWFLGGDSEAAGEHLKKAVSLDAHYAPGRLDLGKWYLKHGRSQEAAREFIRVLKTPPLKKRWIWERLHRPQAQNLLRQMRVSESPGPPG